MVRNVERGCLDNIEAWGNTSNKCIGLVGCAIKGVGKKATW